MLPNLYNFSILAEIYSIHHTIQLFLSILKEIRCACSVRGSYPNVCCIPFSSSGVSCDFNITVVSWTHTSMTWKCLCRKHSAIILPGTALTPRTAERKRKIGHMCLLMCSLCSMASLLMSIFHTRKLLKDRDGPCLVHFVSHKTPSLEQASVSYSMTPEVLAENSLHLLMPISKDLNFLSSYPFL